MKTQNQTTDCSTRRPARSPWQLNLLLCLLLFAVAVGSGRAQTPFEGLRFNMFGGGFLGAIPMAGGILEGTCSYKYMCASNAVMKLTFDTLWDSSLMAYVPWTNGMIKGTNIWAVDTDTGAIGAMTSQTWVAIDTNGNQTGSWDEVSYNQQAITPFLGQGNVQSMTGVDSKVELVIAGDAGVTNDVVVKFTIANFVDADTGAVIPDGDITVDGQSVTNGVAWNSHTEHSVTLVTPAVTNHANWTGELSAVIYRLSITGENILYLNDQGVGSSSTNTLAGDLRLIATYTDPITSTSTIPVVIGSLITLSVSGPPQMTNFNWTVSGSTVSNFVTWNWTEYVTNANGSITTNDYLAGKPVFDFPKTNQSVQFAWWKPGAEKVKITAEVMGKQMSFECKFNVQKPSVSIQPYNNGDSGYTIGQVYTTNSSGSPTLKLGLTLQGNYGVYFSRSPAIAGAFGWTQTINSSSRLQNSLITNLDNTVAQVTYTNKMTLGLDGGAFPEAGSYWDDSPGLALRNTDSSASVNDAFSLYLMYRPVNDDSAAVWVPLNSVDWDWVAGASNTPDAGWQLIPAYRNGSNINKVNESPGFPQWLRNRAPQ